MSTIEIGDGQAGLDLIDLLDGATFAVETFDWDPEAHPRGPDGKFEGGGGADKAEKDDPLSHLQRYDSIYDVKAAPGYMSRLGDCYAQAVQHVVGVNDKGEKVDVPAGSTLVHGMISGLGQEPICHAWAQHADGSVHDAVLGVTFHPDDFAKIFSPTVNATYTAKEAVGQLMEHQNYGPWDKESNDWYDRRAAA